MGMSSNLRVRHPTSVCFESDFADGIVTTVPGLRIATFFNLSQGKFFFVGNVTFALSTT